MPELYTKTAAEIAEEQRQIDELRTYLATSEPFRHCRGKLGGTWNSTGMFHTPELKVASPTAILETFDLRNGQLRVLMNHLAKLRRDGHHAAFAELSAALNYESFVITGEEVPLDKRTPGVFLMYDPERMLDLIRWMKLVSPEIAALQMGSPDSYTEEFIHKGYRKDRPGFLTWTRQVLDNNPRIRDGLLAYYAKCPPIHRSERILASHIPESLLDPYLEEFPVDENAKWKLRRTVRWPRLVNDRIGGDKNVLSSWGVACFIPNTTQSEVLSMIKREHQDRIATWQFHYPAHMVNLNDYHVSLGLFPEQEQERFKRKWPSFTSGSLSQGLGAVLLERQRSASDMDDPIFDTKYWREVVPEPDKNKIGIRLYFDEHS